MRELLKKFSRVQLVAFVGVLVSLAAAVLAALGKIASTLLFVSVALLLLISVTAVIHRYLVTTKASTNRQFEKLRRQIEDQAELSSATIAEVTGAKPVSHPAKSETTSSRGQVERKPVLKEHKSSSLKEHKSSSEGIAVTSPLFSPLIAGCDRQAEIARAIVKEPKRAVTFALKVKSHRLRDSFARAATGNFYSYDEAIKIIHRARRSNLLEAESIKNWDFRVLIALAHVLGNQRLSESDLDDARTILVVVAAVFGNKVLTREDRLFLSEIIGETGDWSTAAFVLEELGLSKSHQVQYQFTLANQFAGKNGRAHDWLTAVNAVYKAEGLSQLAFDDAPTTDIDHLRAESPSESEKQANNPLVTVVVPTFEGSARIGTALSSLSVQTWKNLEILVIDDGSSKENVSALREIVADYPSAKLVLLEGNCGAYVARNEGLRIASGDFVTVHDDDDWSHPEKIAAQVEFLLENPELVGTISKHVRVTEDLKFTRINRRPEFTQNNMSSLLLRANDAKTIGGWDEVNRGADEEFTSRLQKVTGRKIGCCSETPLSFTRTHERSLTSGEILRGFQNPSRMLYHSAFTKSHALIDAKNPKPDVQPLPADMGRGMRRADFGSFDYGYVIDTKLDDFTIDSAVEEMRKLDELGYRVAMVHHHSFAGTANPFVCKSIMELLDSSGVKFLSFENQAHFDVLIVRDPRAFEFGEDTATQLSAGRLYVVSSDNGFDLPQSEKTVEYAVAGLSKTFGVSPKEVEILDDWTGLLPYEPLHSCARLAKDKPLVGLGAARSSSDWPGKISELRQAYASNEVYDVLLVDAFDPSCNRISPILKEGAQFVSEGSYHLPDLIEKLDFWVYLGEKHSKPSREILSAIASGLVVIVAPGSEQAYGDAVLYAKPKDVRALVNRIVEFPELYKLQQERGQRYLANLWDGATFGSYIENLRKK